MEAVPKLPLISFELKASPESTHFGPKLKQYIAEAYREDPDSYGNEIHQLEGLRSAAVRPTIDASGLSAMVRYFCQLRSMQSRFPMAKGQPAACSFSWKDLYANMSCSLADIRFEMACILYNIGALHTQLGASEPRNTADSLKAACTHYQNAAWAFLYLREQYPQPQGVDVSTEIMRLLQEICFAQAQECILDKSIQDSRKPSVIGAVATQVMFFYKNSLALLGQSTGTDNVHEIIGTKLYNYWHRYLSFKMYYVGCIVCLYQGMNAEEQQKMGERVAFYQQAVEKLGEARKLAKYIEPSQVTQEALTFTNDVVEGKRKAAKNENEFIYHEEVPEKDLLVDMKPVCLVKALAINFNDKEVSGPDIFSRLVPMGAHEASSMYSEEKAKLLRHIVSQVDAKNTEITEFMSSLQLDQLDVLDSDQKIPQDIVDRCAAMNAKTEIIQTLVDSMNSLAEIISDVEHALAEIKDLIQEETVKEKEFQKVMGARPPSIVQTELARELHKYREAHARAADSNTVLHKAMTLHIANLQLLAQPLDQLAANIPTIHNIEGLDRATMCEMRRVVGKARDMQAQRDALVQQLRAALTADDVTAQLLARTNEPTDLIFKQELDKHTPIVKIIEQNLAAQENIINKLTSLYAAYGDSRRLLADVLRKRDGLINALVTSYEAYPELLGKSAKGLEFYRRLAASAAQLLARLRSTVQVHDEERTQLLDKHNAKAGSASPSHSPSPPAGAGPGAAAAAALAAAPTGRKLKDYLPYMKNRNRSATPQSQIDAIPQDQYYPESIYPTSVRPTPVGSEATDVTQMQLPDGVVMPQGMSPYDRYAAPYAPDTDAYSVPSNYAYPATSKAYEKPQEDPNYYSAYTPPQYSTPQEYNSQYSNPYYSATQNNTTIVTDSQNFSNMQSNMNPMNTSNNQGLNPNIPANMHPNTSTVQANMHPMNTSNVQTNMTPTITPNVQANMNPMNASNNQAGMNMASTAQYYDPYLNQAPTPDTVSSVSNYNSANQTDLSANFAQMHLSGPKSEPSPYGGDYSQTYYSIHYPHVSTPNMATYSHAAQNSNTNMVLSQIPSDYNSLNYPYSNESAQYNQQINPNISYSSSDPQNSYSSPFASTSQGFTYTNTATTTSSTMSSVPYPFPPEVDTNYNPALAQFDAFDKPIKSHVTGEALSSMNYQHTYQNYESQPTNYESKQATNPQTNYTGNQPTNYESNQPTSLQTNYPGNQPTNYESNQPSNYESNQQINLQTNYSGIQPVNYESSQPTNIQSNYTGNQPSNYESNQPTNIQSNYTANQPTNYESNQPTTHESNAPTGTYGYTDQTGGNYGQTYQNHPGYNFNSSTGNFDYNYGSQNTYNYDNAGQANLNSQQNKEQNIPAQGVYTSAGGCETVQSPSEAPVPQNSMEQSNNQIYYNAPYGYQTITNQSDEVVTQSEPVTTNYGANMNQSTYMQSGHDNPNVTYSNNQVSTPKENVSEPSFERNTSTPNVEPTNVKTESKQEESEKSEIKSDLSAFDLLSDIDFTVEHKPLMPEIKVPQVSESAIKKPVAPKLEPAKKIPPKEEVIERPAKRDLFSDPSLLNRFTQEVKNLQKLTDSLTIKTPGGWTLLDAKWKTFQDFQMKENMYRSKTIAMQYTNGNIVAEVVPFDDSRLRLKSDPDAFLNASYYKQLAPWCIPLVISKNPAEHEYHVFWKAVLENKMSCVICLLSEIEMQGKTYWPTAKGQSLELSDGLKVVLDDVICTVHWTERKLTVACGKTMLSVTHYQVNVFPAKIVCSPLVLLADKVLSQTYDNRLSNQLCGAWVQCGAGAGRSAVVSLLIMVMCQVRAGQMDLCDMLDAGCLTLYKHRSNVLEDTKYLADAYKTTLFYVQGVLCSGTTMFNGEAVSVPSGAAVRPPVTPSPTPTPSAPGAPKPKFSRESFEEMKQAPGLKSGDMKDPLNFLDPLWSLKKK